jgi:hypothetical protein
MLPHPDTVTGRVHRHATLLLALLCLFIVRVLGQTLIATADGILWETGGT